jgi:tight adherence protein B
MQLTGEEATFMAGHEIGDPIGAEFRTIEAGMRLGRDLESLLWEIGKHIDAPEFRFFVIALSVQREAGGNLAVATLPTCCGGAGRCGRKTREMATQARSSTMILGSTGIVVSVILLMTSSSYVMPLFTDIRGLVLVGIAVGMLPVTAQTTTAIGIWGSFRLIAAMLRLGKIRARSRFDMVEVAVSRQMFGLS